MDYKISERAKKVTLGTAVLGLVFLIIGFFQQKDFVYAKKVDDHSVELLYNGHADVETQNQLKETITSKMHGYQLEFHDSMQSQLSLGFQTTLVADFDKSLELFLKDLVRFFLSRIFLENFL